MSDVCADNQAAVGDHLTAADDNLIGRVMQQLPAKVVVVLQDNTSVLHIEPAVSQCKPASSRSPSAGCGTRQRTGELIQQVCKEFAKETAVHQDVLSAHINQ